MSGEPIDITTHTHSHFEERIQAQSKNIKMNEESCNRNLKWMCEGKEENETKMAELEKRIVRMEKWHLSQEKFYGVVRERDMLTHLLSDMESKIDDVRQSHTYKSYPKEGFQSGYELNNEIDLRGK